MNSFSSFAVFVGHNTGGVYLTIISLAAVIWWLLFRLSKKAMATGYTWSWAESGLWIIPVAAILLGVTTSAIGKSVQNSEDRAAWQPGDIIQVLSWPQTIEAIRPIAQQDGQIIKVSSFDESGKKNEQTVWIKNGNKTPKIRVGKTIRLSMQTDFLNITSGNYMLTAKVID